MELPVLSHEGFPTTADQVGQSDHGPTLEDDRKSMSQYNFALNMRMTDGNLALDMTGNFGASGTFEYSTSEAPTDTNQYNRAFQLGLGGAADTTDQLSQTGQNFIPETWLPVNQMIPVGAYFTEQQIVGFDGSFSNANLTVPVSDGNTTYLMSSTSDQSTDSWAIAREPQFPDPTLELIEPHSNIGDFPINEPNIDHVISGASFQMTPYGSASHTNSPPLQLPTAIPNSHGSHALVLARRKVKKKRQSSALVSRILPCTTCWGLEKKVCPMSFYG
jgi:hypothetical protein